LDDRVSAVLTILIRARHDPASVPEAERQAIAAHLEGAGGRFERLTEIEHEQAVEAPELARSKSPPGSALLILELAHLNRLLSTRTPAKLVQKLGLVGIHTGESTLPGTPGAAAMIKIKGVGWADILKSNVPSEPAFSVYRAWHLLSSFGGLEPADQRKEFPELQKAFREGRFPEPSRKLFRDIGEALKTPCSRCKGEGKVKCASCEAGEASYVCQACKGWGGSDKIPCACRGAGNCDRCGGKGFIWKFPCAVCKERGRWKDECLKCRGSGKIDCNQCKEPWKCPQVEDFLNPSPCSSCRQSGFAFERVLYPCADCFGLGQTFTPKK
jgi:hypothetical protein